MRRCGRKNGGFSPSIIKWGLPFLQTPTSIFPLNRALVASYDINNDSGKQHLSRPPYYAGDNTLEMAIKFTLEWRLGIQTLLKIVEIIKLYIKVKPCSVLLPTVSQNYTRSLTFSGFLSTHPLLEMWISSKNVKRTTIFVRFLDCFAQNHFFSSRKNLSSTVFYKYSAAYSV